MKRERIIRTRPRERVEIVLELMLKNNDPRHGTVNGYNNLGCRCPQCRAAWVVCQKEQRLKRAAKLSPNDPRHGKASTYFNHMCRCDKCKKGRQAADHLSRGTKPRVITPAKDKARAIRLAQTMSLRAVARKMNNKYHHTTIGGWVRETNMDRK